MRCSVLACWRSTICQLSSTLPARAAVAAAPQRHAIRNYNRAIRIRTHAKQRRSHAHARAAICRAYKYLSVSPEQSRKKSIRYRNAKLCHNGSRATVAARAGGHHGRAQPKARCPVGRTLRAHTQPRSKPRHTRVTARGEPSSAHSYSPMQIAPRLAAV